MEDKWLSTGVQKDGLASSKDSNRACLRKGEYDRGRKVDVANLVARDSRDKEAGRKVGVVTIAFESVRGEWESGAVRRGVLTL